MIKIGVLASGRGSNLQAIIDEILAGKLAAEVKIVISDTPGAGALKRAEEASIPFEVIERKAFPTKEAYESDMIKALKSYGIKLVVLAGFMRVLSPDFIRAFPERIINIHPSLLPAFPGLDVHRRVVEHGVKFSGCTVHFVDEEVDTGPIIIQAVVQVNSMDTPESLAKKVLDIEHRIYPIAIQMISEEKLKVVERRVVLKSEA
jgi:phosphoribosylglycinamide formyltransferase-1